MFNQLLWRPDRIDHIVRHQFTSEEVEEVVFDNPDKKLFRGPRSDRDRTRHIYYVYGRMQAGCHLLVVLLNLDRGQALPVTARDMAQNEKRRYGR